MPPEPTKFMKVDSRDVGEGFHSLAPMVVIQDVIHVEDKKHDGFSIALRYRTPVSHSGILTPVTDVQPVPKGLHPIMSGTLCKQISVLTQRGLGGRTVTPKVLVAALLVGTFWATGGAHGDTQPVTSASVGAVLGSASEGVASPADFLTAGSDPGSVADGSDEGLLALVGSIPRVDDSGTIRFSEGLGLSVEVNGPHAVVSSSGFEPVTFGLESIGRAGNVVVVPAVAEVTVRESVAWQSYSTSAGVISEYWRVDNGIEHGYLLNSRPVGEGPVEVHLSISGATA